MENSTILYIIVYGLIAWFLYSRIAPVKGLKNLGPEDFNNRMEQDQDTMLIDVRENNEYKAGHIPGAVNIPLSRLKKRLPEISKDKSIYLYCRSGMRSKQAARVLSRKGFADINHLQGGILSWHGEIHK